MKIFLTGGTGFIGSHVLKLAAQRGDQVTAIRRSGSQPRLTLNDISLTWINRSLDAIEPVDLEGHDALLHLASVGVSPQRATLDEMVRWNVGATGRLLEVAATAGMRRVVIAGSFAEYGRSADRFEFLPVDAPLEPTNPYAASKAAACMLSFALAAQYGLELCYLRIFSAYGEGQNEANFFPSLNRAALAGEDFPMTSGDQVRDFVPVADVARIVLEAASRSDIRPGIPRVVNVASGHPVALREFAQDWWRRLGARGQLVIGAIPDRASEPKRFAADLAGAALESKARS
jgi:UDP-glucose 4-epimerase